MVRQNRTFTGLLLQKIHLRNAEPRGLRAALALPANTDDELAHVSDALRARYRELDEFFDLTARGENIWKRRAEAILTYQYNLKRNDPEWWRNLTFALARAFIPGFSLSLSEQKQHGAPREWDLIQLAQVLADVEFLKKERHRNVGEACSDLKKRKGYAKRWGLYSVASLRKAYSKANKLRKTSPEFQWVLIGGRALIQGVDPITTAIRRHALKL